MSDRNLRHLRDAPPSAAYLAEIDATLPRVLGLFDGDTLSPTHGIGDRQFWAWKLIDFPNGTFQGAANGLAHLVAAGLVAAPESGECLAERIAGITRATRSLIRRDGSLEEAFPFEQSYCVTALAAFDLLRVVDDAGFLPVKGLDGEIAGTVGPMIEFLKREDETHGFIANHLATAVAGLLRWHRLCGDAAALRKGDLLLERLLAAQSSEGWFPEYGGADPGYQTLCLTYLADAAIVRPSERLTASLHAAVRFLWQFAHPDGSFGGIYGSRCTRLYYPAGIEALAGALPEARALAAFMRASIARRACVPLTAVDQPNLMPVFNNYCWAARLAATRAGASADAASERAIPALGAELHRLSLPEAGLVIDHGPSHRTIVSTHKGGVVYHFAKGRRPLIDAGVALRDDKGRLFANQVHDPGNELLLAPDGSTLAVTSHIRHVVKPLPNPWNFLILRVLALSVMRIPVFSRLIKSLLVRLLITRNRPSVGTVTRTIKLGEKIAIVDAVHSDRKMTRASPNQLFSVIHMASQGYWQCQDDAFDGAGTPPTTCGQGASP